VECILSVKRGSQTVGKGWKKKCFEDENQLKKVGTKSQNF